MRVLCGWYAGGMRVVCGWYAGGMRLLCGCYAGGMRLLCRWYAAAMLVVCACYAANSGGRRLGSSTAVAGPGLLCWWYAPHALLVICYFLWVWYLGNSLLSFFSCYFPGSSVCVADSHKGPPSAATSWHATPLAPQRRPRTPRGRLSDPLGPQARVGPQFLLRTHAAWALLPRGQSANQQGVIFFFDDDRRTPPKNRTIAHSGPSYQSVCRFLRSTGHARLSFGPVSFPFRNQGLVDDFCMVGMVQWV